MKLFANGLVAQLLKCKLGEDACRPSNAADMVAGGVCGLKRTLERVGLFCGWLQLQLGDQLHIVEYSTDVQYFQMWYVLIRAPPPQLSAS